MKLRIRFRWSREGETSGAHAPHREQNIVLDIRATVKMHKQVVAEHPADKKRRYWCA
jgi:hypothetical protein